MGNYSNLGQEDDKRILSLLEKLLNKPSETSTSNISIDESKIANVVSKAISDNIKSIQKQSYEVTNSHKYDSVDDQNSMKKLAESMTVQRGNNQSNFDDLGNISKTKKDNQETKNTINILSNLDD